MGPLEWSGRARGDRANDHTPRPRPIDHNLITALWCHVRPRAFPFKGRRMSKSPDGGDARSSQAWLHAKTHSFPRMTTPCVQRRSKSEIPEADG